MCMTSENNIEQLFRDNYRAMLILACRFTHDEDVARDIVHDVFASLLSGSKELVTVAYLMSGVRFACLNHIRDLSTRDRLNSLYAIDNVNLEDEDWPDEDDVERLRMLVDRLLSDQCRRVVKLRFEFRLSYREISEELSISEVAVYKHLRHAMNVLRQNFHRNER